MLYFDLVMAVPMLVLANFAIWGSRGAAVLFGLIAPVYGFLGLAGFWPLGLLPLLLLVLFSFPLFRKRLAYFFPASLVAAVAAFAIPIALVIQDEKEMRNYTEKWRKEYPMVDLEKTLPAPKPRPAKTQLASGTMRHLEELASDDSGRDKRIRIGSIADELERMHQERVFDFVNRPGFGFSRMNRFQFSKGILLAIIENDKPIPQPGEPFASSSEPEELPANANAPNQAGLLSMHRHGIINFANAKNLGFIKDRNHVVMGLKHGFQRPLEGTPGLEVRRVELVGLLMHAEPVVYISSNLPRMEELRMAPTRPLDAFEKKAIASFEDGGDMMAGSTPEGLRMVGSIRSAKTCSKCHGGEVGDLLGAFSYTLGNVPKSK